MAPTAMPPESPTSPRRLDHSNLLSDAIAFGNKAATVVPPHRIEESGEDHEVASMMELARRQLEGLTTAQPSAKVPSKTSMTDVYAFAFDIDGVLVKGGEPIPQAVQAMKMLNGHNNHGIKV